MKNFCYKYVVKEQGLPTQEHTTSLNLKVILVVFIVFKLRVTKIFIFVIKGSLNYGLILINGRVFGSDQ